MRIISSLKALVVTLALVSAVALPGTVSAAPAKAKLPPGACAVDKKAVSAGVTCSSKCNAQTSWCVQQFCNYGSLMAVPPCFGPFCAPRC